MLYERPKRNRPSINTISPFDDRNYGKWIQRFLNEKTTSRKDFFEVVNFFGGAFVHKNVVIPVEVLDHINTDRIRFLGTKLYVFPPGYIGRFQDDEIESPFAHEATPKIIDPQAKSTFLIKTVEKRSPLVSLPYVPQNAFLISIVPPIWVQICPGAVLYTMGALWCKETMNEYDDDMLTITKIGDEWLVRMSFERQYYFLHDTLLGVYYADPRKKRLWHFGVTPADNDVFIDRKKRIVRNGDKIEFYDGAMEPYAVIDAKAIEKRMKLEFDNKPLYVPKIYVEQEVFENVLGL